MEYLTVAEARRRTGLRLVLTAKLPGPWGESAKAVLKQRNVAFSAVEQVALEANEELRHWTGYRNAPIAILNDEPPLTGWLDILMLAERLGAGPSLLPRSSSERIQCLGIATEICGPHGLGWQRRLSMLAKIYGLAADESASTEHELDIRRNYGLSAEALSAAPARTADILNALSSQLQNQDAVGSPYLVGRQLSACDLYWACFSVMIDPLAHEINPMPPHVRALYQELDPIVTRALDPRLIEHRDHIFENHIGLPLDF